MLKKITLSLICVAFLINTAFLYNIIVHAQTPPATTDSPPIPAPGAPSTTPAQSKSDLPANPTAQQTVNTQLNIVVTEINNINEYTEKIKDPRYTHNPDGYYDPANVQLYADQIKKADYIGQAKTALTVLAGKDYNNIFYKSLWETKYHELIRAIGDFNNVAVDHIPLEQLLDIGPSLDYDKLSADENYWTEQITTANNAGKPPAGSTSGNLEINCDTECPAGKLSEKIKKFIGGTAYASPVCYMVCTITNAVLAAVKWVGDTFLAGIPI